MAEGRGTMPFAGFEWGIAARYLRARRREGFISVIAGFSFLGIMLGVATLIIVMAVMNGFRAELMDRILGFNGHITAFGIQGSIEDYDALAKKLATVPGITKVTPYVEGQVLVSSQRSSGGALVRGIREADLKTMKGIAGDSLRGTLEGFDQGEGIAIGQGMAFQHNIGLGDTINILSPKGPVTPFGVTPRIRSFEVVAIFHIGMSDYDNSVVFMPLAAAQEFFVQEGSVTALQIMVDHPDQVGRYIAALQQAAGPGIEFVSWQTTNRAFYDALIVERNVMFLILTLIILVAALNIVSGLIMLVKDKGADIAILRTMGASRGTIMRVFFITGAAIGVIGTLAGLVLGVLVCWNIEGIRQGLSALLGVQIFPSEIYYLSQLPAKMEVHETVLITLMSLGLAFLATLYPSWRAAKLDPVEALRYE
ncbi:lipoprotein-releasing ABC transporter permease subunit [Rhodoligotrophos ferricapiens]|uniref:lipoprotein-releasing ABC transporter permease subunit n=1 Tax=Rhodoligotrophos ferricapiens TaxID=3069264 RepID=UPI00315D507B